MTEEWFLMEGNECETREEGEIIDFGGLQAAATTVCSCSCAGGAGAGAGC